MTDGMEFLLDILKIVAYIGGAFLVAFRVAKYFIERDKDLKADTRQMKTDIKELSDKITTLNTTLKDYNIMQNQVDNHDKDIETLQKNHIEIMRLLMEIKLELKDKANR